MHSLIQTEGFANISGEKIQNEAVILHNSSTAPSVGGFFFS